MTSLSPSPNVHDRTHRIHGRPVDRAWRHVRALLLIVSAVSAALGSSSDAAVFPVGTTTRTFVDSTRSGRSVDCDIYYPGETSGANVPLADGAFPVVSFGHGFLIGTTRYEYLGNGLASSGFLVVMPRSEGGVFPDHEAFGLDLAFVIRALAEEAEQPGSLWDGHVEPESAVLGHSMGGGASFLAADADPTITAIANLAAAETNPSAIEAASRISIPALLLAGDGDCVTPPSQHQIPMYDALASPCRTLVTVIGGSHCQFADSGSVCELGEIGCDGPGIARSEQHTIVLELLVPWLDSQLRGDSAAWFAFQGRIEEEDVAFEQECTTADLPDPDRVNAGTVHSIPSLQISPNPTRDRVTLELPPELALRQSVPTLSVRIFDASGRSVDALSWDLAATSLGWDPGPDFPSGVYWVTAGVGSQILARGRLQLVR